MKISDIPQAAVILPCRDGKILMQLRDDKTDIVFPGKWGFFSGRIEPGETPLECANRELYEELGCMVDQMYPIGVDTAVAPFEITLHSFYCHLPCPVEEIVLQEGYDLSLFSLQEISTKKLYSPRGGCFFPIIPNRIVVDIAKKCFSCMPGLI